MKRDPNIFVDSNLITYEGYDKIITMLMSKDEEMVELALVLLTDLKQKYWNLRQGQLFKNKENGNTKFV